MPSECYAFVSLEHPCTSLCLILTFRITLFCVNAGLFKASVPHSVFVHCQFADRITYKCFSDSTPRESLRPIFTA